MNAAATVDSESRLISAMYFGLAPATSSTPIAIEISTDADPRSGWRITSTAGAPTSSSPPRNRAIADLVAALVGEVGGEHEQRRELRHLGGLEVERPEVERDPVAAVDQADDEQQRQDHEREAVEERRPLLQPLVVDRHHGEHHDRGDDRRTRPGG